MKKVWLKSAMLLTGATFALGAGGGCLSAVVQRILVAVAFD
jgi:hypothetical protein